MYYKCICCGKIEVANSFDDIVDRKKLCVWCINMGRRSRSKLCKHVECSGDRLAKVDVSVPLGENNKNEVLVRGANSE